MKKTRDTKSILLRVLLYLFVILVVLVTLYPYFVMFTTAAKSRAEIYSTDGTLLPIHWLWQNFQRHLDSGSTFEILYQFTDRCRWFHSDRDRMWYPGSLCTCTNEIQR